MSTLSTQKHSGALMRTHEYGGMMPWLLISAVEAMLNSAHMANIHQDGTSIMNMQMVSSNRVHSTPSCEANKCKIFKPFFCLSDKRCRMLIIKNEMKKINIWVRFLAIKIAYFGVFENDDFLSSKSYTVTKSACACTDLYKKKFGRRILSYKIKFQIS